METREEGYYWVRDGEEWDIAHYNGKNYKSAKYYRDKQFYELDEIGPKIEPPHNNMSYLDIIVNEKLRLGRKHEEGR